MATIVTRSGKGSPLTNNEVDANFTNLNTELGTKADTSSLATVATTGAYADLTGKPTLVDASNVAITGGSITGTTIDSITNHVGADHIHYKVKATQILAKGDVVKVVGFNAGEDAFEVAKVSASTDIAVGVIYSPLASGEFGSIINTGLLEGIDTSAYAIGTTLYPNTTGGFTSTKPTTGRYQALAFVVRSHANLGTILIEASEPQPTSLSQFTNDSGYITGINSGNVTTALGYTPANRAGDTFTGPITVNSGANQAILGSDGAIELTRGAGGAYIDFKDSTAEDFDVRLQASGNQLNISAAGGLTLNGAGVLTGITSGQVTTALGYTPYNASNPAGYITSSALSGYLPLTGGSLNVGGVANTHQFLYNESGGEIQLIDSTGAGPILIDNVSGLARFYKVGSGAMSIGTTGANYLQFLTNGSDRLNINSSGNVTASVDIRAPIFRDSNDTAYYVDPASTSALNIITTAGYIQTYSGGVKWDESGTRSWSMYPSGGAMLLNSGDGAGSLNLGLSGGVRAPIFYDSDNTAYYINGAGNSVLNTLYMRNGSIEAKFAQASQFGYSSSYRTVVLGNEYLTTISMGVDVSGNASGSFNGQGEGREVLFRNGVSFITPNSANNSYLNVMQMTDGVANFTAYATAAGSFRAPIFYDSDNTAFFVDPNSTSVLSTVRAATIQHSSGNNAIILNSGVWTQFCDVNGATKLWLGGTADPNNYYNANIHYFRNNSSADTLTLDSAGNASAVGSYRAPIFYDSNDTGYYVDPNTSGTSAVFAGDIHINDTTWGADKALRFREGATDIYGAFIKYTAGDSLELGTRNNSTTDTRAIYISRGANWAGSDGSFRAPIFYDSQNTAYYIDPNAGSNIFGEFSVNQNGAGGIRLISTTGNQSLWIRAGYDIAPTPSVSATNVQFQSSGSSAGTFTFWSGNTLALSIGGDSATGAGSLRAPIFYDSNDTSYYVDANSTSVLNGINAWGEIGSRRNDVQSILRSYNLSAGGPLQFYLDHNYGNVNIGNSRGVVYAGGSYWEIANSVRAPIFYDSDNTAFYVSPNTTSNVSEMVSYSYRGNGNVGGTGSASWHPSGIYSAGYNWLYGGISAGGGDITAVNAVYANAYYDSGNTGFYLDPATGSYLSGATFTDLITGRNSPSTDVNTANDTGSISIRGSTTTVAAMSFHRAGAYAINMGLGTDNVFRIGGWSAQSNCLQVYGTGVVQALNDFRAPIFYDSNDTGYYVDPNTTATSFRGRGEIFLGPNTSGEYTRLGGNGGGTDHATVSSSNGNLHLDAKSGFNIYLAWYNTSTVNVGGSLYANGNITAYSDIRVKTNVETIPSALDKLDHIRGVTYTRTDLEDKERRYAGVIAQEIEAVLPEAVFETHDHKSVDYNATIALLIQAVKELRDEVEMLRK